MFILPPITFALKTVEVIALEIALSRQFILRVIVLTFHSNTMTSAPLLGSVFRP